MSTPPSSVTARTSLSTADSATADPTAEPSGQPSATQSPGAQSSGSQPPGAQPSCGQGSPGAAAGSNGQGAGTYATESSTSARRIAYRALGADPVAWVVWLYVLNFALQRISLPGISIPLTVPLTVLWLLAGWKAGVLGIEPRRTFLWLIGAGASALVVLPQVILDKSPYVSVNSWAFWMVIWLPACFMFVDRSKATFERALRAVSTIGVWLALLSTSFLALQFAGIPYRDIVEEVVPGQFLVAGFNTSYPFYYGSSLYKSNGWLALEPSFMSFTLGLCIMAGLLCGTRVWKVAVMGVGLLSTVAGSGMAIVLVGVVAMLVLRQGHLLRRYLAPGVILGVIAAPTQIGQLILDRLSEGSSTNSSTALRTFEPYVHLFPRWTESYSKIWFGGGAGSSRQVVEGTGIDGLVVPTLAKVFYDYGIIAGAILCFVVLTCYVRTPAPALGFSVLASMLIIQPPAQPLMIPAFLLTTLWAPVPWNERDVGAPGRIVRRLRRRRRAAPTLSEPYADSRPSGRTDGRGLPARDEREEKV